MLRHCSIATFILVIAAVPALAEPASVQPDASTPATGAAASPRDPATGLPTGKRMHKPFTVVEPVPPPQPAGPQPTPYPNTGATQQRVVYSADPMEGGQVAAPVASSDPQEGGEVAAHKHIAGVKYDDFTKSGEAATVELAASPDAPSQPVEVVGLSWGKLKDAGTVYSADPMEGGQVAGSSANVAQRRLRPGRPVFGNLVDDAPVMVAEPVAKGTATFKTLAGLCATGKHLDKVKITTRSRSFTLHDATVISVTPADAVGGQAMEEVTLSYASFGD